MNASKVSFFAALLAIAAPIGLGLTIKYTTLLNTSDGWAALGYFAMSLVVAGVLAVIAIIAGIMGLKSQENVFLARIGMLIGFIIVFVWIWMVWGQRLWDSINPPAVIEVATP